MKVKNPYKDVVKEAMQAEYRLFDFLVTNQKLNSPTLKSIQDKTHRTLAKLAALQKIDDIVVSVFG